MNKNRSKKILIILLLVITLFMSGCTKQLSDKKGKVIKNPETGQTLTKNIICKPTDKKTIELYEKNGVKLDKLPDCEDLKINSGGYEGLWTSIFVKPLAFILVSIGNLVGNYAVAIIIVTLIIRLLAYPVTKKTVMQSELMKKAQPEIERIQKKYEGKKDQESMQRQTQETMAVYQKYNIKPLGGCLFAMIQLPIFIAFFEAIQRTPAMFEGKFLGLQLGTTPAVGIGTTTFYAYIILIILIGLTTFVSMKSAQVGAENNPSMKMMPAMMTAMILFTGIFMPSGLGIYWVTSNLFTMVQNKVVRRETNKDKKNQLSTKEKPKKEKVTEAKIKEEKVEKEKKSNNGRRNDKDGKKEISSKNSRRSNK